MKTALWALLAVGALALAPRAALAQPRAWLPGHVRTGPIFASPGSTVMVHPEPKRHFQYVQPWKPSASTAIPSGGVIRTNTGAFYRVGARRR